MSMPSVPARLALLLALGACTRSETYGFVAVLGNDTTSVERVTRSGHRIIGDAIGRSPTVTRRHWQAELGPNGVITHWSMDTDIPNGPPDGRHLHHTATFIDTVLVFTRGPSAGTRPFAYRKRYAETVPWNAFVYATWELMLDAARRQPDTTRARIGQYFFEGWDEGHVGYADIERNPDGSYAATQLTTSAPIELAGVPLHPGTYTLWTLPTRGGVSLIINGQFGQWGTEYHADKDVARRLMSVDSLPGNADQFTIRIEPAGRLVMEWGTFQWSATIRRR